jgi:glycosyltransferase involved in cell wall biosynthesis
LTFLPSAAIEVIPNGVDLARFHPVGPESPRGRGHWNVLRLLTVGRLSATKRLPLLIEAVELLTGRGAKVSLTIVGGGAQEPELRRLLGEKNLRGAVTLTGRREGAGMPKLYQQHDLFVSASMQEGMSNAMLEAMASGLPVVTTRCEGVAELIADNGVVVEDPQPAALAAAIEKLTADRTVLKTMSVAARQRAEAFGWSEVAESYLRLYAKVK